MKRVLLLLVVVAFVASGMSPWATAVRASDPVKPFVVTFLFAESWTDGGWNMAHKVGVDQLKSLGTVIKEWDNGFLVELPDKRQIQVNLVTNVGYGSEIETTMRSALEEQKPDMLFGTWYNAKDAIAELAPKYPNVKFEHASGYPLLKSADFKNVSTYFIKQEDGDYVMGYVSGLMGFDKIGLVATIPIPEPVRGINAFALGQQKGLKEAGKDPKQAEVRVVWIQSWLDAPKEREAAEGLLGAGYKVIRQMPDTPTASMAACDRGATAIGYGSDVSAKAPCAIGTNTWQWGTYYKQRVLDAMDGKWVPADWYKGFDADAVGLVFGKGVDAAIQAKATKLAEDLKAGKVDPFDGPVAGQGKEKDTGKQLAISVPAGKRLSDMERLSMQWTVDGVKSELPDFVPSTPTVIEVK